MIVPSQHNDLISSNESLTHSCEEENSVNICLARTYKYPVLVIPKNLFYFLVQNHNLLNSFCSIVGDRREIS